MLHRADLVSENRQNRNAGNAGDLLKHSAYLALVDELVQSRWHDGLRIVEAHSGKGVYAATSPMLRRARALPGFNISPLGIAQANAFAESPVGLGRIGDLRDGEVPYAGSAVLHALALRKLQLRALVLMDHGPGVRNTVNRIFREPALSVLQANLQVIDPGPQSEGGVLVALERGEYSHKDIIHFDPFAFVMHDRPSVRSTYRRLVARCDELVGSGQLAAATLFVTWGSNSRAALDDLDGSGYRGGLAGGYQDLVKGVDPSRRVVLTWCGGTYFSQLLIVPSDVRSRLLRRLNDYVQPFAPLLSRLAIQ